LQRVAPAAAPVKRVAAMGKAKKFRAAKVRAIKRTVNPKHDPRLKDKQDRVKRKEEKKKKQADRHVDQTPASMFFAHNTGLGPPFHVIVDTNFINFSIKNKIDLVKGMTDCLLAKCVPVILDSVMAELEKLGTKYRLALRLAKDPRFLRMPSYLKRGTYADDDIVEHCRVHRCFIVATCDKDLKKRLRKIPGVPIMYIQARKYVVERLPDQ
jgi:U3 small nucleolar RNA-associated protein 24